MTLTSISHKIFLLVVLGLVSLTAPAFAQTATARWRPVPETIVVTANAAAKNLQAVLTGTNFKSAFAVSASLPVPYGDLDLSKSPDLDEFDRRIHVAANLVCMQIDLKYPRSQYPVIAGDDCYETAVNDGLARKNEVIAARR